MLLTSVHLSRTSQTVLPKGNRTQSLPTLPKCLNQVSIEPLSTEKDSNCVYIKYIPAQSKKASVVETNKAICMVPVPRKVSFLTWVLSVGCVWPKLGLALTERQRWFLNLQGNISDVSKAFLTSLSLQYHFLTQVHMKTMNVRFSLKSLSLGGDKDESWNIVELRSYYWFSFYRFPPFFLFLLPTEVAEIPL